MHCLSSRVAIFASLLLAPLASTAACDSSETSGAEIHDGGGSFPSPGDDGGPGDPLVDAGHEASADGGSSDVVQVSAGRYHSCARRASGAVTCWGHNTFGALGTGQLSDDSVAHPPSPVVGLDDATQISAGESRTCALKATGTVVCWGSFGSVGNGNTAHVPSPTPIVTSLDTGTLLDGVVDVGASWHGYGCVRRVGGTVTCWGADNATGRNGDGTTDGRAVPGVDVLNLTDAEELMKGESFACARRSTGSVSCWGLNVNGQLGTGTGGGISATPVDVTDVSDATALGGGQHHTCARHADGTVSCWGTNSNGQLGNGAKQLNTPTPVKVSDLSDATQLAGGAGHSCALRANGTVVCWGSNDYGQLGDGTKTERLTPVAVSGLTDAVQISSGVIHMCALRATGATVCWGSNSRGQLGDGTKTERLTPHEITGL